MPHRTSSAAKQRHHAAARPTHRPPDSLLASALRESLREHGAGPLLRSDALAGVVVGLIALPLSMALAIATGMPPQAGIYTAIVAGVVAALLGGSRVQVTGPTAAFVVVLAPVVSHFGPAGLMVASLGAGVILLLLGLFRMGRLVEFIPNPVVAGFTLGIAIVIALIQVKDLLGLQFGAAEPGQMPAWRESNLQLLLETARTLPTIRAGDAIVGALSLALFMAWPRISRRIPSALVVLPVAAIAALVIARVHPEWTPATIDSRFGGIPRSLPGFLPPWNAPGPEHAPIHFDFATITTLLKYCFAIAMLGAIESLLSAVIADSLTGRRHHPDGELVGQGIANIVAPFFGGFAATGALARTAANVRAGAKSPLSAMTHALFLLAAVALLAPLLGYLPMASLAALLLVVAQHMSGVRHCWFALRRGPRGDSLVLILCAGLTVAFDMVIAVSVGVVLASLLFMRRMAELSAVELEEENGEAAIGVEHGILYYRIRGPLFFGAAQRAMSEVQVTGGERVAILDMDAVPMMDATGLINLESAVERLHKAGLDVILCSVGPRPMKVLTRAGFPGGEWRVQIVRDRAAALAVAAPLVRSPAAPGAIRGGRDAP